MRKLKLFRRIPRDGTREDRIAEKVLALSASAETRTLAWREYIVKCVSFPFVATYMANYQSTSDTPLPFCPEARVLVMGLASEQECNEELVMRVMDGHKTVRVPLALLWPNAEHDQNLEAILDWHYWALREEQ